MTMREVTWRVEAISKRKIQEIEMNARLHGCEIEGNRSKDQATIDDSAKEVFDKLLEERNHGK